MEEVQQFLKRRVSIEPPSYFSHSGTSLLDLKQVLSLPSQERSAAHLALLVSFTSHIRVFEELAKSGNSDAHNECCRSLFYEHYATGEVRCTQFIFHAGDQGSKFYVVISGSVAVLAPLRKRVGKSQEYRRLAVLRQGEFFGELALINYKPRAASVLSREDTHLAVLERDDYFRALGKNHNDSLQHKLSLLYSMPVFASWTKAAVQTLSYFLKERVCKRGQVLFRAGEAPMEVFIVMKGEFQLTKDVKKSSKSFQVDVTLVTTGELLGGEECLNSQSFSYSCRCHSTQGEVLFLSSEDFLSRVNSEATVSYLHKIALAKEEYRLERALKMAEVAGIDKNEQKIKDTFFEEKPQTSMATRQLLKEALQRDKANKSYLPGLYIPTSRDHTIAHMPVSRQLRTSGKRLQSRSSLDQRGLVSREATTAQKHWGDICARKFPVEKLAKTHQKRQHSVVNFHRQYLRECASNLDFIPPRSLDFQSLSPPNQLHLSRQSLGVTFVNLSLDPFN